jgi:hypothetical protein
MAGFASVEIAHITKGSPGGQADDNPGCGTGSLGCGAWRLPCSTAKYLTSCTILHVVQRVTEASSGTSCRLITIRHVVGLGPFEIAVLLFVENGKDPSMWPRVFASGQTALLYCDCEIEHPETLFSTCPRPAVFQVHGGRTGLQCLEGPLFRAGSANPV